MEGLKMTDTMPLLSPREQVIERVVTLFDKIDQRDWEAAGACFTEKVLFNTTLTDGNPEVLPRDRIIEHWKEGLGYLDALHHMVTNFLVQFDGDKARVACYGITYHYLESRNQKNTKMFAGNYHIHLKLLDNQWKIDEFHLKEKFVAGNLHLGE